MVGRKDARRSSTAEAKSTHHEVLLRRGTGSVLRDARSLRSGRCVLDMTSRSLDRFTPDLERSVDWTEAGGARASTDVQQAVAMGLAIGGSRGSSCRRAGHLAGQQKATITAASAADNEVNRLGAFGRRLGPVEGQAPHGGDACDGIRTLGLLAEETNKFSALEDELTAARKAQSKQHRRALPHECNPVARTRFSSI